MEKIFIFGSSGHAKVVAEIVEIEGRYKVLGFIDPFRVKYEKVIGYSVLGSEQDLPTLIAEYQPSGFIVGIGDNFVRSKVARRVLSSTGGLPLVSAIHPSAIVGKDSTIGEGSVLMAGAIVNPGCQIGKGCIVNTNASIDHDSTVQEFSSLAPGSTVGGGVKIGRCTAIGLGASVIHNVSIGDHTVIGAGALVLKNLGSSIVAYGAPAKPIRMRCNGDAYL